MNRIENKISTRARLEAVPYSFSFYFLMCVMCVLFFHRRYPSARWTDSPKWQRWKGKSIFPFVCLFMICAMVLLSCQWRHNQPRLCFPKPQHYNESILIFFLFFFRLLFLCVFNFAQHQIPAGRNGWHNMVQWFSESHVQWEQFRFRQCAAQLRNIRTARCDVGRADTAVRRLWWP